MTTLPLGRLRAGALLLLLLTPTGALAEPASPLTTPAAGLHLHTGAAITPPPGDSPHSRLWLSLAFQLGSVETRGWGETTSSRGGLVLGGEWFFAPKLGLAVGGSLALLELFDDHVVVDPAIDEHETRLDLGATRLYLRYLIGDSTRGTKWLPHTERLTSQLGAYLRFTLPTATSVLSRARHPRPPLRDAFYDGVNDMRWTAIELGAHFGLVVARWYSVWIAYTPLYLAVLPEGDAHLFFQTVDLVNVVRLPMRLPGDGALELVVGLSGRFRFPIEECDDDGCTTHATGLAYFGLRPGVRYRLPKWTFSVGAALGFGDWVELGERWTVGLEAGYFF